MIAPMARHSVSKPRWPPRRIRRFWKRIGRRHLIDVELNFRLSDQTDQILLNCAGRQLFSARRNCRPAGRHLLPRYTSVIPADHDDAACREPGGGGAVLAAPTWDTGLSGVHPTDLAGFPRRWRRLAAVGDLPSRQTRARTSRARSGGRFSPRRHSHGGRYRCSSHRYPSPSPARYCRPRQSPDARPGHRSPEPAAPARHAAPRQGSAEASGCALARQARRAAHPAGQFARHGASAPPVAGLPPPCSRRQQLAQLRETYWAIPMPTSWRPIPGHLVPARGRGRITTRTS
jgi:hypothetical protein